MAEAEPIATALYPYLYPLSEHQVKVLQVCQLASSLLSVTVGTFGVVMWIRMAPQRRVIFRLQLLIVLILSDYLKCIFLVAIGSRKIATLSQLQLDGTFDQRMCDGFGFLCSVVTFYSDLAMFCITVHNGLMIFATSLTKPYRRRLSSFSYFFRSMWQLVTFQRWFYKGFDSYGPNPPVMTQSEGGIFPYRFKIIPIGISTGILLSGLMFIGPDHHYMNNNLCSPPYSPIWKRVVDDWAFKYLNMFLIITVYLAIIIYLRFRFRSIEKTKKRIYKNIDHTSKHRDTTTNTLTTNPGDAGSTLGITMNLQKELMMMANDTHEKRRQAAWRETNAFVIYPLGYLLVWITPTIIQVWNYTGHSNGPKHYAVYLITAITIPLSCCVDTIIFMVKERPWTVTANRLRKNGTLFGDDVDYFNRRDNSTSSNQGTQVIPLSGDGGSVNDAYDLGYLGGDPLRDEEMGTVSKFGTLSGGESAVGSRKHSQALSNSRTLISGNSRSASFGSFTNLVKPPSLNQVRTALPVLDDVDQEDSVVDDDDGVMDLNDFLRMGP